ncbi:MAG TPA: DegT/DnrJ/EryC1/StrS aminotransferase family protein [Acidobacteriaceae bacterium]|nr:DegT/DnrJ/EryC1/StrS aminotransferase family protein [Acidobacteriaceae bacterium]
MIEIPLSAPDITEDDLAAVTAVLRTPQLSRGPQVEQFESAMASYIGVPHAIAVSSGTAALHLALLALGIGLGDEVIVPSFAFVAVASAVLYVGARPVFADVGAESLNLSPDAVEAAITLRTRAIIAVHTFGRPADLPALLDIAQRHSLMLIEDACEAIGAEIGGRRVGSFGDAAVFGFYPNKQITTGEGGMVVTLHGEAANRMRALRNHGRYEAHASGADAGSAWPDHVELGYNYRLTEMQAALGLAQLGRIDSILAGREAIARRYAELLGGDENLQLPAVDIPGQRMSWFVFVVRLIQTGRDGVMRALADAGIATGRYFAPIHLQPAYSAWRDPKPLANAEFAATRTLALPFFSRITDDQICRVCAALRESLRAAA